jgi:hypothetical protein
VCMMLLLRVQAPMSIHQNDNRSSLPAWIASPHHDDGFRRVAGSRLRIALVHAHQSSWPDTANMTVMPPGYRWASTCDVHYALATIVTQECVYAPTDLWSRWNNGGGPAAAVAAGVNRNNGGGDPAALAANQVNVSFAHTPDFGGAYPAAASMPVPSVIGSSDSMNAAMLPAASDRDLSAESEQSSTQALPVELSAAARFAHAVGDQTCLYCYGKFTQNNAQPGYGMQGCGSCVD